MGKGEKEKVVTAVRLFKSGFGQRLAYGVHQGKPSVAENLASLIAEHAQGQQYGIAFIHK